MTSTSERTPWLSRALARLLDHRKRLDYLWLAAFAALPIVISAGIGVNRTIDDFAGYWDRLNWMGLVLLLPAAALGLRQTARLIAPVSPKELPPSPPPVIGLVQTDAGRRAAYAGLRRAILAPGVFLVALLATLAIHAVDMAQLGGIYLSPASHVCRPDELPDAATDGTCARDLGQRGAVRWLAVRFAGVDLEAERDWSLAYLSADAHVSKWLNLGLTLSAYAVQFALVFLGILFIIIIVRHNLFFLSRIYQRRRVEPGDEPSYIHIDLDDEEKCFGFRSANDAFNVQVLVLAIAAIFILWTRFANVGSNTGLFPDAGQWIAVFSWLVALVVVSLPILVKLLPRLPLRGAGKAPASLVGYLREFLSDDNWALGEDTPRDEIDAVSARFAENAFWPTGNNRAWQLYFLAFWVFFVALVPDPRAVVALPAWSKPAAWALSGVLAWGATWLLFRFLRAMLFYVDKRLVDPPELPIGDGSDRRRRKLPIGVFISYRRAETAPYAGRLFDSLARVIDRDRLFMDFDKIRGGTDFLEAINKAIASARAMIVVIGPQWLSIALEEGPPRIQDPNDPVHQEVALALAREIHVFPVLVGGTAMPSEDDLPDGLKTLATWNACEITDSRWDYDVGRLVEDLAAISHDPR